jgi:hypothetical protein
MLLDCRSSRTKEGLQPFPLGEVEAETFMEIPILVIALQSNPWMVPLWILHPTLGVQLQPAQGRLNFVNRSAVVVSTPHPAPTRSRRLIQPGDRTGQPLVVLTAPGQRQKKKLLTPR